MHNPEFMKTLLLETQLQS